MSHHLTETLSRQVSYQPCPKPPTALPSYQSCPKPPSSLTPYQPCPPPKPPGLPGCSSLLDDASSSAYSTEVKVTDESGGVIKSLSFQPEPLQTKMERADGYDYRYAYANTYRYDDYWGSENNGTRTSLNKGTSVATRTSVDQKHMTPLKGQRTWF